MRTSVCSWNVTHSSPPPASAVLVSTRQPVVTNDNPILPVKQRRVATFDFQQKINLNMVGQIGDKLVRGALQSVLFLCKTLGKELDEAVDERKMTEKEIQLMQAQKLESLGHLAAGIAHEIQNPLNFVNNFSDLNMELIDEQLEEIEKENLEEIKAIAVDLKENEKKVVHHGKRAEEIVKSMLLHSRGSEGTKEPVNLNQLSEEYLRLAYHGLRAKDKTFNAAFKTELDPEVPEIQLVRQDIGRVYSLL